MSEFNGVIKLSQRFSQTAPTRICLLCDKVENLDATIIDTGTAWLCPECKDSLRKMMRFMRGGDNEEGKFD